MSRLIALCLCASLGLGLSSGCTASSPGFLGASQASSRAIEGKMVLPYRVQESQVAQAPGLMSFFLGAPAHADDLVIVPITRLDLNALRATVNGQPVSFEVRRISFNGDDTVIEYHIDQLPLLPADGIYTLEVLTRDGLPLLGGMVSLVPGQILFYDLDVRTTALLVRVKQTRSVRKVGDLTLSEIRALELDPDLLNEQASIRSLLRRDGTLKQHGVWLHDFDDDDRDDNKGKSNRGKGKDKD